MAKYDEITKYHEKYKLISEAYKAVIDQNGKKFAKSSYAWAKSLFTYEDKIAFHHLEENAEIDHLATLL